MAKNERKKTQKMPNIGEEVEELKLSCTAGVSVSTCNHSGNWLIY